VNYRNDARKHLERFEHEFRSGDKARLKYSALELRMAMEALTYDRALLYMDEFPASEYKTWQPRRVMSVLLEIEPLADKDCSVAISVQETYGTPASIMSPLGSEKVFNMATLRKHYDALGSYLHVQTMKQAIEGKSINYTRMESRLEDIAKFVKEVLSSHIFNVTMGVFSKCECIQCGKTIRKRVSDKQQVQAKCDECNASYTVISKESGKVDWRPNRSEITCANSDCNESVIFWETDIEIGKSWNCPRCEGVNTFVLGIFYQTPNSK